MNKLFIILLVMNTVHAETKLVTISEDRYSFNTVQVTAILSSDIRTTNTLEQCETDYRNNGFSEEQSKNICQENEHEN